MYAVIKTNGEFVCYTDDPVFVGMNSVGTYVSVPQENAPCVSINGVLYNILGSDTLKDSETVVVSKINPGSVLGDQQSAITSIILSILEG